MEKPDLPAYEQVKAFIKGHISSGQWRPGDPVPSESTLAQQFAVARMTVNRALRELAAEGLVTRIQGSGTRVAELHRISSRLTIRDIHEEVAERGHVHTTRVLLVAQEKAGRLRVLGVSTPQRMQAAPNYPTIMEQGFDVNLSGWFAAFVAAGTPAPIVAQLNQWLNEAVNSPEGKKFLNDFASDPWVNSPEDAQALFLKEIKAWAEYVTIAKIEKQG